MKIFEISMIAVGVSMDAGAISTTNGMVYKGLNLKKTTIIAGVFGLFQGFMPFLGYLGASLFSSAIENYDHWIALILLSFIGGKMILDSIFEKEDEVRNPRFTFKLLIMQAIATSIDALAVGISFAAMQVNILHASICIASITFVICFIAIIIGRNFGNWLNKKAEIIGGSILIIIGLKIFFEHMFWM